MKRQVHIPSSQKIAGNEWEAYNSTLQAFCFHPFLTDLISKVMLQPLGNFHNKFDSFYCVYLQAC